jgi:hypothetical protein
VPKDDKYRIAPPRLPLEMRIDSERIRAFLQRMQITSPRLPPGIREDLERLREWREQSGIDATVEQDREAIEPPPPAAFTSAKKWIEDDIKRLAGTGELTQYATQKALAEALATRMQAAADLDSSIHPVRWSYIANNLKRWGLWVERS